MPSTKLAVNVSTSAMAYATFVSLREDALPLLGLVVSVPIVGDGTLPVARVLAKLESSANPTAGGLYWYTLMTFFCNCSQSKTKKKATMSSELSLWKIQIRVKYDDRGVPRKCRQ